MLIHYSYLLEREYRRRFDIVSLHLLCVSVRTHENDFIYFIGKVHC